MVASDALVSAEGSETAREAGAERRRTGRAGRAGEDARAVARSDGAGQLAQRVDGLSHVAERGAAGVGADRGDVALIGRVGEGLALEVARTKAVDDAVEVGLPAVGEALGADGGAVSLALVDGAVEGLLVGAEAGWDGACGSVGA